MNYRDKSPIPSLLATGVTGVVGVAHAVWVVVGAWLAMVGWLSWFTYIGVGLLTFLAVRGALSLSERMLSEFLGSASQDDTNEPE
jgi:hypothetical protein